MKFGQEIVLSYTKHYKTNWYYIITSIHYSRLLLCSLMQKQEQNNLSSQGLGSAHSTIKQANRIFAGQKQNESSRKIIFQYVGLTVDNIFLLDNIFHGSSELSISTI